MNNIWQIELSTTQKNPRGANIKISTFIPIQRSEIKKHISFLCGDGGAGGCINIQAIIEFAGVALFSRIVFACLALLFDVGAGGCMRYLHVSLMVYGTRALYRLMCNVYQVESERENGSGGKRHECSQCTSDMRWWERDFCSCTQIYFIHEACTHIDISILDTCATESSELECSKSVQSFFFQNQENTYNTISREIYAKCWFEKKNHFTKTWRGEYFNA